MRRLSTTAVGWGTLVAVALLSGVVAVTWKAQSPLLFLLYPLLVLGTLGLLALAVLWTLRHF